MAYHTIEHKATLPFKFRLVFIPFRSEKNWLCEQSHAGLERADVMHYLEVISNTCTEELPNLFNINNGKGRVERIVDIYRANRVNISFHLRTVVDQGRFHC